MPAPLMPKPPEAMSRLNKDHRLEKNVVAFIEVPGWVAEPRKDLQERLASTQTYETPLDQPLITHWLHDMEDDKVMKMLRSLDIKNEKSDKVKLVFIPCYLIGDDGIVNLPY